MTDSPLEPSRTELAAARVLADNGFPVQAISRAYYAAFRAAEAALEELGESRSKHSGVVAAFGRRMVKEGGLGRDTAQVLASLFKRRLEADYESGHASTEEAMLAIEDAAGFVDEVGGWLERR